MKKITFRIKFTVTLFILFLAFGKFTIPSQAGTLQPVGDAWTYQNDDGSFAVNTWVTYQGGSYYFDSNALMLRNTLSPDGSPLGRDGRLLSDNEIMPSVFPGTEEDFNTFFYVLVDYLENFDASFNIFYDNIYRNILYVHKTKGYADAHAAISLLDSIDFTPYLSSDNIAVRRAALYSDIFRIEQVYLLSEYVKAREQQNSDYIDVLLDRLSVSITSYADGQQKVLDQVGLLYRY